MVFENVYEREILVGQFIRLEPLTLEHVPGLYAAGNDPEIWRYLPFSTPADESAMLRFVSEAIQGFQNRLEIPYAIVRQSDNEILGSTRYYDLRPKDRSLEIGWSWLGEKARRTAANTETKFLLLRRAFETLGAIRVQIKTDERNLISQRAIERLGAVREGVLRKQRINPDGFVRNAVYYSIVDEEWPVVKERLLELLR